MALHTRKWETSYHAQPAPRYFLPRVSADRPQEPSISRPSMTAGPLLMKSWKVSTRRPHLLRSPLSTIIKDDRPHHPAHSPQQAIAPRGCGALKCWRWQPPTAMAASAGDKFFMRVAKRATEKFLRLYYRGVTVGQTAMEMIMYALRVGSKPAGLTWRALVYTLRTVVPGVLVTVRDALIAEKTPEGSDHAPIPGTYSSTVEGPEAAAEAEATSDDHVEPEPAPRRAQPRSARPQFRPTTRPEGFLMAESRASQKSPIPVPSKRCSPYSGLFRNEAERRAFQMSPYAQPSPFLRPMNAISRAPTYYPAPYPRAGWTKSPYNPQSPHGGGLAAALRPNQQVPADPEWREILDFKQRVRAFRAQMLPFQKSLSRTFDISLTDVADFQRRQLICLGPYWARRLEPFVGADGKELPVQKLTPDQLGICRALVEKIDPRYYAQAAVMLHRDDGQLLVAMRLEVEPLLLTDDRGLVTAGSSDNGATRDYVKATNVRGDPTRVLYPVVETSNPMEIDGGDCSVSFLLKDDSLVKGCVLHHEGSSVSYFFEDDSKVDLSMVRSLVVYDSMVNRSPADVSMTDAHEEDVSMADAFDL